MSKLWHLKYLRFWHVNKPSVISEYWYLRWSSWHIKMGWSKTITILYYSCEVFLLIVAHSGYTSIFYIWYITALWPIRTVSNLLFELETFLPSFSPDILCIRKAMIFVKHAWIKTNQHKTSKAEVFVWMVKRTKNQRVKVLQIGIFQL